MKLAHTMIRVKDLDATLEFYVGFLGLEETRRKPIGDEVPGPVEKRLQACFSKATAGEDERFVHWLTFVE